MLDRAREHTRADAAPCRVFSPALDPERVKLR